MFRCYSVDPDQSNRMDWCTTQLQITAFGDPLGLWLNPSWTRCPEGGPGAHLSVGSTPSMPRPGRSRPGGRPRRTTTPARTPGLRRGRGGEGGGLRDLSGLRGIRCGMVASPAAGAYAELRWPARRSRSSSMGENQAGSGPAAGGTHRLAGAAGHGGLQSGYGTDPGRCRWRRAHLAAAVYRRHGAHVVATGKRATITASFIVSGRAGWWITTRPGGAPAITDGPSDLR